MKAQSDSLIKNILCVTSFAVAGLFSSVNADVVVTQFASWSDGNAGGSLSPTVAFDIVNSNSILIATIYVDTPPPVTLITNVRFGNGGGIGSGDVAPTLTIADGRLLSYVFINPSTASGLSFRADNSSGTVGAAAALYEVSGANTDTATFTTVSDPTSGATTITTTTASELIVSFAGRNGGNQSLGTPTIFTAMDIAIDRATVRGNGGLSSASATAPTIGSQDITWTANTGSTGSAGRIAYAFEAAPAVLEASPTLTNFSFNAGSGTAEVSIKGAPGTRYKLVEAGDLNFATPDQDPIPLTGATVGTLDGNEVIANASGDATLQFNLGTSKAATFLRAVTVP